MPAIIEKRLTCSQIKCARKCLRKHLLAYILRIRTEDVPHYFRTGKIFHKALDLRAQGIAVDDAITEVLAEYDQALTKIFGEEFEKRITEREIIARLIGGYSWRWENMDKEIKVVASELPFELPIYNPVTGKADDIFVIAGKIDKIIKLPDGRLAVMEHKTTSDDLSVGSHYWKRLRIDIQISIYYLAARMLGFDVETILYDVVRKPSYSKPKQLTQAQTKQLAEDGCYYVTFTGDEKPTLAGRYKVKKLNEDNGGDGEGPAFDIDGYTVISTQHKKSYSLPETITMFGDRISADMGRRYDYYFARREVPRLEHQIFETQHALSQYAQMVHECDLVDRWPMNDDACVGFGTCPYLGLCSGGFDIHSGVVPEGFVRVEDVHQELE